MKILIAAAGSGGHLFPAEQLASQLIEKGDEVLIAGHGLSKSTLFKKGLCFQEINAASPKKPLKFILASFKGLFQAISMLLQFSPDTVVGFGSYHTFPVLLASVLLRKRIVLFEANTMLGKVNRLFTPFAKKIATQFPCAKSTVLVSLLPWGYKKKHILKEEASRYFGLDSSRFTVLVFGGSQGAQFLNTVMPEVASGLDVQWIHITGKGKKTAYNASIKEFEKRMDLAYTAADMVICRSGASTLSEIIRYKKPSLLIPFPFSSENHQMENARFLVEKVQGARLLDQKEATPERIKQEIEEIRKKRSEFEKALGSWEHEGRQSLHEELFT